ncbi:protein of unknown function [Methylocaldum szegediense]|uniref:Uncharacterized protein n=1 Tax=Methylocaldum szegediense TaxID=73780 RepID=A0ABN8X9I2_9GAMM|nr:protein of unknown function [Methylocaldum szegediense]
MTLKTLQNTPPTSIPHPQLSSITHGFVGKALPAYESLSRSTLAEGTKRLLPGLFSRTSEMKTL